MSAIQSSDESNSRWVALVDDLRGLPAETNWVEFKANNYDPARIGKTASALANAAVLAERHHAYMVWGVADETHNIVETNFEPSRETWSGQPLALKLAQMLSPSPNFEFHVVAHPEGRVVLLEIPAATSAPVKYDNIPYIRIGSATPKLSDYPERERDLWTRLQSTAWETGIALQFIKPEQVIALLDVQSYFELLNLPEPSNHEETLQRLQQDSLIAADVGGNWNILNLGAMLLARKLESFSRLSRKAVRVIQYEGRSRVKTLKEQTGAKGYASGFQNLIAYLTALLPQEEVLEPGGRQVNTPSYPEVAIRELVANALIHQDMTVTGAGPMIEVFSDRIEITNPGRPLIEPDRFIDQPPRSRNEMMASMMRRMNFCEERGSGIDKVIVEVELRGMPPPDFRQTDNDTRVVLLGPRKFSQMTVAERMRACYQHTVLQWIMGDRATNSSFRKRFSEPHPTTAQISNVFRDARDAELIKLADANAPKSGYQPIWA